MSVMFQRSAIFPFAMRTMLVPRIVTGRPGWRNAAELAAVRPTADDVHADVVALRDQVRDLATEIRERIEQPGDELLDVCSARCGDCGLVIDQIVGEDLVRDRQVVLVQEVADETVDDRLVLLDPHVCLLQQPHLPFDSTYFSGHGP